MTKNINYFSKSGKNLAKPSMEFNKDFPILCIHREDLQNILVNYLENNQENGAKVSFINGSSCISADNQNNQGYIELSTGELIGGDIVIGADGLHSKIRESIIPSSLPVYCGYTYYRATLNKEQIISEENNWFSHSFESWGDGKRFGYVPLKEPSLFWFASIPSPPLKSPDGEDHIYTTQRITNLEKNMLLSKFSSFCSPINIKELIQSTNDNQILRTDIYKVPVVPSWFCDRLVLLGDSAHATSPNLAQGAGLAIEDSIQLAFAIHQVNNENISLDKALQDYQSVRIPRAKVIQFCADLIASIGQMDKLSSLRDFLMYTPTNYLSKLEQNIFARVASFTLSRNWNVPYIGKPPSLWERILKSDFQKLPNNMQKFRNSDNGSGRGRCWVEYPNVIAKMVGFILSFPKEMSDSPFVASVESKNNIQNWKRIFGYQTKFENTYETKMKFFNDLYGNGCLLEQKSFFQFVYHVEYQSDKNCIYYCTKQFYLFPGLPLFRFLSPHSEWVETPTEKGWKFDGVISLPIIGRIFRYHGTFEIDE